MRQPDSVRGARTLACRVGTPADAGFIGAKTRRDESRRCTQECVRHGISIATIAVLCLLAGGCAKKETAEAESVAPVEVAAVAQDSIRRLVEADAVLYPIDQASVMPKISAPVQRFLVNRGDHVRAGQLLAVLENRDLVGLKMPPRARWIRPKPICAAPNRPRCPKRS
jgi:HlyD family secretion protein